MNVHQFYDNGLAHASYAILSEGVVALIDPARDPQPYLDFAAQHHAKIQAIIETHPHADFVSSHLELHLLTGAPIYTSRLVGAEYTHQAFDDGDHITLGKIDLEAINTPGHSPDSICVLLRDELRQPYAVFTGDTLFVGDVGRPDLRENVGNITAKASALARQLYHATRHKLMSLPPHVLVYPAHGPGSLCGKNMSNDLHSTIGREVSENYALQPMDEEEFVALVTEQQPFVPKYFEYDVALNKKGANGFSASIEFIPTLKKPVDLVEGITIVDGRPGEQFRAGHLPAAINIPDGLRFETWLGAVINPNEPFYLLAENAAQLQLLVEKAAKIGYEQHIEAKLIITGGPKQSTPFNMDHFIGNPQAYTIVDIRNRQETAANRLFEQSLSIPLPELRERLNQIPTSKPIAVHCAGGYRSAIGSSIIAAAFPEVSVQDISNHILDFTAAG
ncbi:MBL fold metallo-hydrolase [Parapedobacter deserti]|uniref:MBL fold metallo-hydrolase n=1 Tax=Parapedobacter deserti TaxID=1912957 RepID=A0ABV7JKP3_9SPHI